MMKITHKYIYITQPEHCGALDYLVNTGWHIRHIGPLSGCGKTGLSILLYKQD